MQYSNLTPVQIDALKEVGNIGIGNSATALSKLLNKRVNITVPAINILPFDSMFQSISEEEAVVAVVLRILGDIPGNLLFIFEKETAFGIVSRLTGEKLEELTEMGNSAICEVGNIIGTSYMNAIAKITGLTITPSVPAVTYDMLGAILSTTFIESGQFDEYVLDIETLLIENDSKINAHFYYIPVPGSLEKILSSLGIE